MRARGIRTHVLPGMRLRSLPSATRTIRRLLADEQVELVHSCYSWSHAMMAPAAWLRRVPQVWFHHGPVWPKWWQGWTSMVPARAVLANSRYLLGQVQRTAHLAREHHVQHLCIDADAFAPDPEKGAAFRARHGLPADRPAVGIVGFLDDAKGQKEFVQAAVLLAAQHPTPVFVVVGGPRAGPAGERGRATEREIVERAAAAGIADRLVLTGPVDVLEGAYDALDVMVHAATFPEAFGMVVLEAMAKGRAVIAADEGGPREIVTDGVDGLLIPPRDPARLAAAIGALLDDAALRARLGAAGRRTAASRFSPRTAAAGLEQLYDAILPARL
jgi:glycosyltransferase involved in cell wall biosynthesis